MLDRLVRILLGFQWGATYSLVGLAVYFGDISEIVLAILLLVGTVSLSTLVILRKLHAPAKPSSKVVGWVAVSGFAVFVAGCLMLLVVNMAPEATFSGILDVAAALSISLGWLFFVVSTIAHYSR